LYILPFCAFEEQDSSSCFTRVADEDGLIYQDERKAL
jgi:hypothetical protein